jgi:hypothetical protein
MSVREYDTSSLMASGRAPKGRRGGNFLDTLGSIASIAAPFLALGKEPKGTTSGGTQELIAEGKTSKPFGGATELLAEGAKRKRGRPRKGQEKKATETTPKRKPGRPRKHPAQTKGGEPYIPMEANEIMAEGVPELKEATKQVLAQIKEGKKMVAKLKKDWTKGIKTIAPAQQEQYKQQLKTWLHEIKQESQATVTLGKKQQELSDLSRVVQSYQQLMYPEGQQ